MKPTEEQEQAAVRLYQLASQHDNGQARYVGLFLLSLYNGVRFPFDMTNFRCLDTKIFKDCLAVMISDYNLEQEIHEMLARVLGRRVDFEDLARYVGARDNSLEPQK